jgi:predicted metalloprotease
MELNKDAQIDTSQVTDARGGGGRRGVGGIPMAVGGGGILTTLVVLGIILLTGGGQGLLGGGDPAEDSGGVAQSCATSNPDRTQLAECRNNLFINSIQNYWQGALPQTMKQQYEVTDTVFFDGAVSTGCGPADSGVGPFYCPADHLVYIDLSFYQELADRFGAKGEFAQPYVLAHEYGHHVQNLLGTSAEVERSSQRDPTRQNELSVRLELQADCYAGVWANHAKETTDAGGQPIFTSLTQTDVDQALEAAAAIGDDAIQRKAGTRVDESKFTHGTSAQRQQWFNKGFHSGDPTECDTFTSPLLG